VGAQAARQADAVGSAISGTLARPAADTTAPGWGPVDWRPRNGACRAEQVAPVADVLGEMLSITASRRAPAACCPAHRALPGRRRCSPGRSGRLDVDSDVACLLESCCLRVVADGGHQCNLAPQAGEFSATLRATPPKEKRSRPDWRSVVQVSSARPMMSSPAEPMTRMGRPRGRVAWSSGSIQDRGLNRRGGRHSIRLHSISKRDGGQSS